MKHLFSFLFFGCLSATLAAQTLPSVQEVYRVFQAKCVSCHKNSDPSGGLSLEGTGATELLKAVNVAQKLVNIAPVNAYAQGKGYKRIVPGRPDRSFLFRKINGALEPSVEALHANEGNPMPNYGGAAMTTIEKEIIRQWILYGAKTSGVLFDKSVVENFYNNGGEKSFPDGPPPAPAPGEGFQLKMGPFFLPPDGEVEYYHKYQLSLPADVEVKGLDFKISNYSHHFILYNFTGNTPGSNVPDGLRLDANHTDISLVAAVQEALELRLPQTTAFKWNKNVVLDFNSHYINYSLNRAFQCEAYVNVYTQTPGTAAQEMFATLLVRPNIPIANNGNLVSYSQPVFQSGADSIYVWGLMGHTHKYGAGYKVWYRKPNGQKGEQIYDASCPMGIPGCPSPYFDYRHIPIRYWEPLLPIKWGEGIIHEAQWVNDGPKSVNFGPTSDDEMMVLIAFYTLEPVAVATGEPGEAPVDPVLVTPNPAEERVIVQLPGQHHIRRFQLFDGTGRLLQTRHAIAGNTVEVEVSELASGVYFFNADGRAGRIVVQH